MTTKKKPTRINRETGEIQDGIDQATAAAMRQCDATIARADRQIADLKDDLKNAHKAREAAVARLRELVRGERALPFDDGGAADDDAGGDDESAVDYATRRTRELRA